MNIPELQALLPPFDAYAEVIVPEQSSRDIIREVMGAHKEFSYQYDCIAPVFAKYKDDDLCHRLFDFCKQNLKYVAESEVYQSTRSPSGILATRNIIGVDCKHYSGWIAGVLDAIGRYNGKMYDWNYRFAGYENDRDRDHVFVICVLDSGKEIWIDPAPIWDKGISSYVKREYNDRFVIPKCETDKYLKPMLVRLSGASMGDASESTQALNEVEPGLGDAVNKAISTLPDGDIKYFLQSFMKDPGKAIITLIKGRTYTIGDYSVGEMYMRNILGMTQVQSWQQVPDGYVPQAWLFFSAAMGVRIRTNTDLDALCGYANTRTERAQNYLTRLPEETHDISMEAAVRAAYMFGEPGYDGLFSIWQNRDNKWPMSVFNVLPYVYPVPGAVQDENFTGMHPVLGKQFVNGYPIDYVGPRYISQVSHELQPGSNSGGSSTPGTTVPNPGNVVTPGYTPPAPPPAKAGMDILPIVLLAGVGAFIAFGGKGKNKGIHGPSKPGGWLALGALLIGGYMWYESTTPAHKRSKLVDYANGIGDALRRGKWQAGLSLMSDPEIEQLYDYMFNYEFEYKTAPSQVYLAANILYRKYGIPDFADVMTFGTIDSIVSTSPALVPVTAGTITPFEMPTMPGTVPAIQIQSDGGSVLVPLPGNPMPTAPIFMPAGTTNPYYQSGGGGSGGGDIATNSDPIYRNTADTWQEMQA